MFAFGVWRDRADLMKMRDVRTKAGWDYGNTKTLLLLILFRETQRHDAQDVTFCSVTVRTRPTTTNATRIVRHDEHLQAVAHTTCSLAAGKFEGDEDE